MKLVITKKHELKNENQESGKNETADGTSKDKEVTDETSHDREDITDKTTKDQEVSEKMCNRKKNPDAISNDNETILKNLETLNVEDLGATPEEMLVNDETHHEIPDGEEASYKLTEKFAGDITSSLELEEICGEIAEGAVKQTQERKSEGEETPKGDGTKSETLDSEKVPTTPVCDYSLVETSTAEDISIESPADEQVSGTTLTREETESKEMNLKKSLKRRSQLKVSEEVPKFEQTSAGLPGPGTHTDEAIISDETSADDEISQKTNILKDGLEETRDALDASEAEEIPHNDESHSFLSESENNTEYMSAVKEKDQENEGVHRETAATDTKEPEELLRETLVIGDYSEENHKGLHIPEKSLEYVKISNEMATEKKTREEYLREYLVIGDTTEDPVKD